MDDYIDDERIDRSLLYYFQQINLPLLTENEEKELSYRILNGDNEARNILIERNLRLVVNIAKRYIGNGLPFMDLIQEGNIGLIKAASKYDASKGYRFCSYAVWYIKSSIQYAIYDQSKIIKVPVYLQKIVKRFNKDWVQLQTSLNRIPTKEEVIKHLNITDSEYNDYMLLNRDVISIQEVVDSDRDKTLESFLAETATDVESVAVDNVVYDEIIHLFKKIKLTEKEIDFLLMRYGFYDNNVYTLEEIGNKYGITRQAVYYFLKSVLEKLRRCEDYSYRHVLIKGNRKAKK